LGSLRVAHHATARCRCAPILSDQKGGPASMETNAGTKSASPMRAAIAGLGVASTQVLPAMERMAEVEIVAAADLRPEARQAFEQRYGGRAYETVEELADDPNVEVIWVSTPNQFHADHVVA